MKSVASIFTAPALCLMLLGGMALEKRSHTKPEDAAPYHARAKAAIDAWPVQIGKDWTSRAWKIPDAAVQLLRPNTTLSRRYVNVSDERQWADLLVVQCRDPNDMSGHYPPNCYPANGEPMVSERPRTWQVSDRTINGMEYQFERGDLGKPVRYCVYNFFELPGRGIVPDMQQVREATGDYQRRYFGAAQFQVVFPPDVPQQTRDEIFRTLIGANPQVFSVLNPGGI
jgi:hypothetical protein